MSKTWFYRRAFKKQRTEERSLSDDTGQIDIHGATCVVETRGAGRDILYLSSGMWFADESAFIGKLAELGRVTAPVAPGFCPGAVDARMNNVDDIAYLWLDLIDELKLKDVLLVGASFGGWVAAEMAVKSCKSIAGVALIDPVGIKVGDRYARDIADLYGLPEREILRRAYVDPSVFASDVKSISDAELARRARAGVDRALWMVAVFARSQAGGALAPRHRADAGVVGCQRRRRVAGLRARLRRAGERLDVR